jgi:hypothetical protein
MVSAELADVVGSRSTKILLQAASANHALRNDSQKCRATRLKRNGDQEWLPKDTERTVTLPTPPWPNPKPEPKTPEPDPKRDG